MRYKFKNTSDSELIHLAEQLGLEEGIVLDDEGSLANREEIIKAINEIEEEND